MHHMTSRNKILQWDSSNSNCLCHMMQKLSTRLFFFVRSLSVWYSAIIWSSRKSVFVTCKDPSFWDAEMMDDDYIQMRLIWWVQSSTIADIGRTLHWVCTHCYQRTGSERYKQSIYKYLWKQYTKLPIYKQCSLNTISTICSMIFIQLSSLNINPLHKIY